MPEGFLVAVSKKRKKTWLLFGNEFFRTSKENSNVSGNKKLLTGSAIGDNSTSFTRKT
jgi:hypothetical protein